MCKIGKVYVIGLGPGAEKEMTYQASTALEKSEVIIGYTVYTGLIRERFPDKKYLSTPMRQEVVRCEMAMDEAMKGRTVAMVCSGDAGIYGMAGILLEIANEKKADVEIETVPGVTAASAAASILGAPLMHDFTIISLSDLMTPYSLIMKRVDCAGPGDFIVCLSYITTLDAGKDAPIDMFSIVIVGNSNTYVRDGKMITPRGYEDKYGFANVE